MEWLFMLSGVAVNQRPGLASYLVTRIRYWKGSINVRYADGSEETVKAGEVIEHLKSKMGA